MTDAGQLKSLSVYYPDVSILRRSAWGSVCGSVQTMFRASATYASICQRLGGTNTRMYIVNKLDKIKISMGGVCGLAGAAST